MNDDTIVKLPSTKRRLLDERTMLRWQQDRKSVAIRVDRIFAVLLIFEWVIAVKLAVIVSPLVWAHMPHSTPTPVWAAVVLGGLFCCVPCVLVAMDPGRVINRHVIAVCQMLMSGLWIHLTGGRIETHFHVFGSLAFLSLYRDWKVLVPATLTTVADHFLRSLFWPQSIFGVVDPTSWRWLEHASWVLFEDSVLVVACMQAQREMQQTARRWACLTVLYDQIDAEVRRQTQELQISQEMLCANEQQMRQIIDAACDPFIAVDAEGRITDWSRRAETLFGWTKTDSIGEEIVGLLQIPRLKQTMQSWAVPHSHHADNSVRFDAMARKRDGSPLPVEVSMTRLNCLEHATFCIFVRDISERQRLLLQLSHAQKMESIGQLAAGIAHEINTPTQFAGDNLAFLRDAFRDLEGVFSCATAARKQADETSYDATLYSTLLKASEDSDLDYLREEIPKAIEQSLDGIQRISAITRSMKEFSHPGNISMTSMDVRKAIENTLTVSRNEWKYVADIVTDFDPALTSIECLPGEFNQVLLNIIVNAGQAIGEMPDRGPSGKRQITISTYRDEDWAEISIADNGPGIPEHIRQRIFDPFFTTKEVGKGTGQGLAIAHAVIVEKHHGTIHVRSEVGCGTTFVLRVPIHQQTLNHDELEDDYATCDVRGR
ncbi:PAS domain S-box protein [bacterium]|nr:PAS domain S-box protein [bacterium]